MPLLELNGGLKLCYNLVGKGETVAFLNGIMMSTDAWALQREAFSPHYRVLLHDFQGQGRSAKPATGYSLAGHCTDLLALLDHLKIGRVHLVGTSYGGEVAMLFAARYPQRVHSLTVAAAVSEIHPLLAAMGRVWVHAARWGDPVTFFEVVLPFIYSNGFLEEHGQWLGERAKLFARVATPQWFKAFLGLMDSFNELHLTPALQKIDKPSLVLAAELDILKPPYYSEIIACQIKGARLEVIPEAGHALSLEKPGVFNDTILKFLASLASK